MSESITSSQRLGEALGQRIGLDAALWRRTCQAADALWGECEPVLCPLENGTVIWEAYHEHRAPGYRYWLAYTAISALPEPPFLDALLYAVAVTQVEATLQEEGGMKGDKLNVCACKDSDAFAGCVWAQQWGAPIYTVIGAVEEGESPLDENAPCKVLLRTLTKGHPMEKALPDVVCGRVDAQDVGDAMAALYDEEGYLLHPHSARAYAVAQIYREESEDRHTMVVIAEKHPYVDPLRVHEVILEYAAKDEQSALETLQETTGWPCDEEENQTDMDVRNAVREYMEKHDND